MKERNAIPTRAFLDAHCMWGQSAISTLYMGEGNVILA